MKIGDRLIGPDCPPLVIAEIGINHEGSLKLAKKMVDAAVKSGAEFIKFQTHVIEDEMTHEAKNVTPTNSGISLYDMMQNCSLTEEEEIELKKYVEDKGCTFLSTPSSRAAADRLNRMGVVAFKIGSGECNNYPLIEYIASLGKPLIVSTGMNDLESIDKTVSIIKKAGVPFALLHCTHLYPTKPEQIRLGAMLELMEKYPDIPIGLSDHSMNNNACLAATALGACILERHFTDNMYRQGPDICYSMDPVTLSALLYDVDEIYRMRGGRKEALKEEQAAIDYSSSSVVAVCDIKSGEEFTKNNLWVKRPGTGEVPAASYTSCLGKKSTRDIKNGEQLLKSDLA